MQGRPIDLPQCTTARHTQIKRDGCKFFRFVQVILPSIINSEMALAVPGALQIPCSKIKSCQLQYA